MTLSRIWRAASRLWQRDKKYFEVGEMSGKTIRYAFVRSLPIMCSYFFISLAYGITMAENGFAWYYSLLASVTVYTGAFQFVLITFLSSGASLLTVALTALLMNSRQSFYSLTFLKEFKRMGRRKLYMIHTMTDETYAVNCTLELPEKEKQDTMFLVAILSKTYWVIGSVLGGDSFMLPALLITSGILIFAGREEVVA